MLAAVIYLVHAVEQATGTLSFAFADLYRARLPIAARLLLLSAFALSFEAGRAGFTPPGAAATRDHDWPLRWAGITGLLC